MHRIAFVATTLACLAGAAHAAQEQQVRATWYGNELRGNRTASGEMFNPDGLTAAHKSLPFGTCLVVSNPKTGKSVQYLMPSDTNMRTVFVDNSTTPVTFWVGSNHDHRIVKVEPLD